MVRDNAYNYVAAILAVKPELLWRLNGYGLIVGSRGYPGFVRAVVALVAGDGEIVRRFIPSSVGRIQATVDFVRNRAVEMVPLDQVRSDARSVDVSRRGLP